MRLSPEGGFLSVMTEHGRYGADDRPPYALPDGWNPVDNEVLKTARTQALAALTGNGAVDAVARYYTPEGSYAGTLFLDVEPNDPFNVEAADLYAVTTLSMKLDARHGRLLLGDRDVRAGVHRQLRSLDPSLPITDLEHGAGGSADTLQQMYELHHRFRTLLAGGSQRWVTAAKLCARKRPRLFPVRDNLVCVYLGGGRPLKSGDGWPGDFSVDIQVYAHLMTHPPARAALSWLREEMTGRGLRVDDEDLRLLDAALWMAADKQGRT